MSNIRTSFSLAQGLDVPLGRQFCRGLYVDRGGKPVSFQEPYSESVGGGGNPPFLSLESLWHTIVF